MKTLLVLVIGLFLAGLQSAAAYPLTPLLAHCLEPYKPVQLVVLNPIENGVFFVAYTGAGGELIQAYVTDAENHIEFYVDGASVNCRLTEPEGDLPTITLYPLGGHRWTWAVQDDFGNWHTVKLRTGEIVQTSPEYLPDGISFTRLVVQRNQPTDSARYHIFDEFGNIAG